MDNMSYLPEKALGIAIVTRAVLDALGQTSLSMGICRGQRNYYIRQARAWLFSTYEDKYKTPFSFPWWCEILGIDINRIRMLVLSDPPGRITTNKMDDLNFYLRVYDDHTSAPYRLAL